MERKISVCDRCSKRSEDYYNDIGWVHIGPSGLTITNGRCGNGGAIVARYTNNISAYKVLDFCSWQCFLAWLFYSPQTKGNLNQIHQDEVAFAHSLQMEE
jgi:hypothetical protein